MPCHSTPRIFIMHKMHLKQRLHICSIFCNACVNLNLIYQQSHPPKLHYWYIKMDQNGPTSWSECHSSQHREVLKKSGHPIFGLTWRPGNAFEPQNSISEAKKHQRSWYRDLCGDTSSRILTIKHCQKSYFVEKYGHHEHKQLLSHAMPEFLLVEQLFWGNAKKRRQW